MNIYLFNIFVVNILGFYFYFIKPLHYENVVLKKDFTKNILYLIVFSLLLFFEMAFIGDWLTDIKNYYFNFSEQRYGTLSNYNIKFILLSVFKCNEISWFFLNVIIKKLTESYLILLSVASFIVTYGYIKVIKKYSEIAWISMVILLCSGSYYLGWNVVRQSIAASLFCLYFKYLFGGKFFKYCIGIIFTTTFHFSAITLIPIYFILKNKFTKKLGIKIVPLCIIICVILYFKASYIVSYILNFMYEEYKAGNAFGMGNGITINSLIKYLLISFGIIINVKKFNLNNPKELVIVNGSIILLFFSVMSAKIFMIQRMTHYFIPFIMLGYPIIINRSKNKKISILIVLILFTMLHINFLIKGKYYFFWDNKYLNFL